MSLLPPMQSALPLQEEDLRILAELSVRIAGIGLVVDCSKCGGAVPLTICQSDRSGNQGKPMARVSNAARSQCVPCSLARSITLAIFSDGFPNYVIFRAS